MLGCLGFARVCGSGCAMLSITSWAERTSVAPSRMSALHPAARGSIGLPGTAITSRPRSEASRAVMSEPERIAPSTTSVACANPAMMRLR